MDLMCCMLSAVTFVVQPGAYDLSTNGSSAKTTRSSRAGLPLGAAVAARAAIAVSHADQDASQAAAAGFGSTSSRFGDTSSSSPGPGGCSYRIAFEVPALTCT
jgi:hypothetical protein